MCQFCQKKFQLRPKPQQKIWRVKVKYTYVRISTKTRCFSNAPRYFGYTNSDAVHDVSTYGPEHGRMSVYAKRDIALPNDTLRSYI